MGTLVHIAAATAGLSALVVSSAVAFTAVKLAGAVLLNPKTALFFLAFLLQFVDRDASHPAVLIALLGLMFAVLGLVTDSLWALVAGTAGGLLRRSRGFVHTQRYVTGAVYVGLVVATASAGDE